MVHTHRGPPQWTCGSAPHLVGKVDGVKGGTISVYYNDSDTYDWHDPNKTKVEKIKPESDDDDIPFGQLI